MRRQLSFDLRIENDVCIAMALSEFQLGNSAMPAGEVDRNLRHLSGQHQDMHMLIIANNTE